MIYIYLIILSINGKKIQNKIFILAFLRTSMEIIKSILIIPIQGIFSFI